jgi:hypothetical protein
MIIRDYWTKVVDCEVVNVGGKGFFASHLDNAGLAPTGNLVEVQFLDCKANRTGDTCFYLGASNNNKLTDGRLLNVAMARLVAGVTAPAIYIGSSAGWAVDDVHCYGGAPSEAIQILNGFSTQIGKLYVEVFTKSALTLANCQYQIYVESLVASAATAVDDGTGAIVLLGRSSAVSTVALTIGSIEVRDNGALTGTIPVLRNLNTSSLFVNLSSPPVIGGSNAARITSPVAADTWARYWTNINMRGTLSDNDRTSRLFYQGRELSQGESAQFSGNGAQSFAFTFPKLSPSTLNRKVQATVMITGFANDTGARTCSYVGLLTLSAKTGTTAWRADLLDVLAPVGFSSNPALASTAITATGTPAENAPYTINFTQTDATGQGVMSLVFGPATGAT